ncbi:MAG: hypothetical protein ACFB21_16300 [Opitutales bacterium]
MGMYQRLKYLLDEGFFIVAFEVVPLTGTDFHAHLLYRWPNQPGGVFRLVSEHAVCSQRDGELCSRLVQNVGSK